MQAKAGREHILGKLTDTINTPREDFKPQVPRIVEITIPKEFIGAVIGLAMMVLVSFIDYHKLEKINQYDTDRAKKLLKEAGYENGFSFSISVPSNYQPHIDVAQVLVEQYKKIGVNATIQLVEWNSWLSDVYTDRKFESTVIGVDASYLAANALLSRFESTASNNFINFYFTCNYSFRHF